MATVGTEVTHPGQGTLTYNSSTGAVTRTLNGVDYVVNPGDAKYQSIYNEYVNSQKAAGQTAQAGYGAVSNAGQGTLSYNPNTGSYTRTLNGNSYQVNKGDSKYDAIAAEYARDYGPLPAADNQKSQPNSTPVAYNTSDTSALEAEMAAMRQQLANMQYNPVDVRAEAAKHMSYEEAVDMARSILEPQYVQKYQQSADSAASRLASAGLSDSLFGQKLSADAQNQVSRDLEAAIGTLGQQLMEMDYDKAIEIAKMMQDENQFGADLGYKGLNAASDNASNYLNTIVDRDQNANNFAIDNYKLQLEQEQNELERQYREGQLTQMEYENALTQAKTEYQNLMNNMAAAEAAGYAGAAAGSGGSGSSGSSSSSGGSGYGGGYGGSDESNGGGTPKNSGENYLAGTSTAITMLMNIAKSNMTNLQRRDAVNKVLSGVASSSLNNSAKEYVNAYAEHLGLI